VERVDATQRLAELLAQPEAQIPLDEAALLIAAHAQPGLDVGLELARIDELAAGVRDPTLTGVVRLLFRDLGFTGNRDDYYDPRNSFLNEVITRRTGIPITLSVLTMEVARRVAVPLWGVGMPGHFLLRDKVDPTVFVDPFSGGQLIDVRGCERLFRQVQGPGSRLDPAFLEPVPRAHIVARMLANLRGVYTQLADRRSLRWVLELRTALPGAGPAELGELALVLPAVGDLVAAAAAHARAAGLTTKDDPRHAVDVTRAAHLRARLN
jgi:regulator of sirC expression with transglutaminase-like and TPR domain